MGTDNHMLRVFVALVCIIFGAWVANSVRIDEDFVDLDNEPRKGNYPGVMLDGNGASFDSYPGVVGNDDEPCPLPENVESAAYKMQSWTPYGGNAKKGAYVNPLNNPVLNFEHGQCNIRGIYLVARHCTRLPTIGQTAIVLKNDMSTYLTREVSNAIEELNEAASAWKKAQTEFGTLSDDDAASALQGATDSQCTKCGMREAYLIGKRFGQVLSQDLHRTNTQVSVERSATLVDRAQATSHAFFTGLRDWLTNDPHAPSLTDGDFGALHVPKCKAEGGEEMASFLRGRAHTVCKTFAQSNPSKEEASILPSAKTKKLLKAMLRNESDGDVEIVDQSSKKTRTVWDLAARVAMVMCARSTASGNPEGAPGYLSKGKQWCDFLDPEYINAYMKDMEIANAGKQGPLAAAGGWQHMGLLAQDFVRFYETKVRPGNTDVLPVRVLHAHAETVLPAITLLGWLQSKGYNGDHSLESISDVSRKVVKEQLQRQAVKNFEMMGKSFDEVVSEARANRSEQRDHEWELNEFFHNSKHVPYAANMRFEYLECVESGRNIMKVRQVLNEDTYGPVKDYDIWKSEMSSRLTEVGYPEDYVDTQDPNELIEGLDKVCRTEDGLPVAKGEEPDPEKGFCPCKTNGDGKCPKTEN